MLTILLHSPDPDAGLAVQQACQAALDAVLPPAKRSQVHWLTALPDLPELPDQPDQPKPPKLPHIDLLLSTCPPAEFVRMTKRLRPQLTLAVLALPAEGLPSDLTHHPADAEPADLAAADDLLIWPCGPETLQAHFDQWVRRIHQLEHAGKFDERLDKLTRENSKLRRHLNRQTRLAELRNNHDGNLRQILARVEGITRLCQQINSLQLEQVVGLCIQRVPELLGARLASVYLHDEAKRTLRLQRHNHPYPINAAVNLDDRPNSPMVLAVSRKQLMMINEPAWAQLVDASITRPYAHRYASGNCVIAPLCAGGRVVGVLNLADKQDGLPFDELTDLLPIRQLSELLGASIRNIELYQAVQQQAKTDGMTGLANHGTFVRELGREIHRASRYGGAVSLILADVDSLKRINDLLGHLAGDHALQMVARQIVHSIRESDLAARYGGDEFAILLPSTTLHAALAVAERIVAGITAIPLVHGQSSAAVTISVGVGQYDGKSTADQFLDQIDQAMYQAKREGKNRIAACT